MQYLWTRADLDLLPENGNRYEIVAGELLVTRAPPWQHQATCLNFCIALRQWSQKTDLGYVGMNVGVIFSDENDVISDVVWLTKEKYQRLLDDKGHLAGIARFSD